MDLKEAMKARHSVRAYTDRPLEAEKVAALQELIEEINAETGLSFRLALDEPKAFGGMIAHYGHFSGVKNYVALTGKKADDLDERVGYWGERLALAAQCMGLNTCWVALTYNKRKAGTLPSKEAKTPCVLTLGYGATQGKPRKTRTLEEVAVCEGEMPAWFRAGAEAALLAPTAINQQKFRFTLLGEGKVHAEDLGGPCSKIDLGIVKYHFEIGAEREIVWA